VSRETMATVLAVLVGPMLVACASPVPREQQAAATKRAPKEEQAMTIKPSKSGYANVNGVRLYHEVYGAGEPLVLLHGGLMTIPEMAPLVQALAVERQVIAIELQGHGRTADTDRPLRLKTMGDDVATLIEHLGLRKADVVGYSLGADVAMRTAIQHPDRVRRLVVLSTPYARSGWYPDVLEGMAQVNAKMAEQMKETPTGVAARDWPQPERFPQFLDKLGAMMAEDYDWSAEVRRLQMPVMLVYADHDAISTRHMAEFFALLGGGLKDPGWQYTQLTNARLAIIPGYSHYNFYTAPELGSIIEKFLADPLTKPQGGEAAAASKATQ
jgi:pimeloyl-ACP methyl ester carboxylesterase